MGATTFYHWKARGDLNTAKEAFQEAVDDAAWEHGHGGYTGTLAEKRNFIMIGGKVATYKDAEGIAAKMIEADDNRISDKWGPAGCIEVDGRQGGWLFFGWASC